MYEVELKFPLSRGAGVEAALVGLAACFRPAIEQAGADALELNLYNIPTNQDQAGSEIEKQCYNCWKWGHISTNCNQEKQDRPPKDGRQKSGRLNGGGPRQTSESAAGRNL